MLVQGRHSKWDIDPCIGPDLQGRSYEEVEKEASCIKLGQNFSTFKEYGHCLELWAMLNGKSIHRYKTKQGYCATPYWCGDNVRPP